ncbi:FKB20 [Auxenochlorella protothecoides x Auxenochlorella symbiontica]
MNMERCMAASTRHGGRSATSLRGPLITAHRIACAASRETSSRHQESGSLGAPVLSRRQIFLMLQTAGAASLAPMASPPPALSQGLPAEPRGTTQLLSKADMAALTPTQRQLYEYNHRLQVSNGAPAGFPGFVREGYDMRVIAEEGFQTTPEGLIYKDYEAGTGELPQGEQQVLFDYTAYNEAAGVIDSSYRKNAIAKTRLGIGSLIPGFEMGLKTMRVGGKRRIVVPPELGPPVGPATFFSAKQFEVFDVELRGTQNCRRRQTGFFSDVVCE